MPEGFRLPASGFRRLWVWCALSCALALGARVLAAQDADDRLRPFAGFSPRGSSSSRTFLTGRPGLIAGNGRPIADLVPLLSQMVSAPVVDQTALNGAYDLKLEWTEELPIYTALREQLGLRLEPITLPVATVVVTSIRETPTPD